MTLDELERIRANINDLIDSLPRGTLMKLAELIPPEAHLSHPMLTKALGRSRTEEVKLNVEHLGHLAKALSHLTRVPLTITDLVRPGSLTEYVRERS